MKVLINLNLCVWNAHLVKHFFLSVPLSLPISVVRVYILRFDRLYQLMIISIHLAYGVRKIVFHIQLKFNIENKQIC